MTAGIGNERNEKNIRISGKVYIYIPAQLSTMCMRCMPSAATGMCIDTLVARPCNRAVSNCYRDMVHQLDFQPDST